LATSLLIDREGI